MGLNHSFGSGLEKKKHFELIFLLNKNKNNLDLVYRERKGVKSDFEVSLNLFSIMYISDTVSLPFLSSCCC